MEQGNNGGKRKFRSTKMSNNKNENLENSNIEKEEVHNYANKEENSYYEHKDKTNKRKSLFIGIVFICIVGFFMLVGLLNNDKKAEKDTITESTEISSSTKKSDSKKDIEEVEDNGLNISSSKDIKLTDEQQEIYNITKEYLSGGTTREEYYNKLPSVPNKVRWLPGKKIVLEMIEEKNSSLAETALYRNHTFKDFFLRKEREAAEKAVNLLIERKAIINDSSKKARVEAIDSELKNLSEKIAKYDWA